MTDHPCSTHPDPQTCWDSRCTEPATVWWEDPLAGCLGHFCAEHDAEATAAFNAIVATSDTGLKPVLP